MKDERGGLVLLMLGAIFFHYFTVAIVCAVAITILNQMRADKAEKKCAPY